MLTGQKLLPSTFQTTSDSVSPGANTFMPTVIPPLSGGATVLLGSSPEVHQQSVFQRVDGLVGVQARKARLTLSLGLSVNCRKSQEVVLVTESPNSPHIKKRPLWSYLEKDTHTHTEDKKVNRIAGSGFIHIT